MTEYPERIRQSIQRRGYSATAWLAIGAGSRALRGAWRYVCELAFDLRNGVNTRGTTAPQSGLGGDAYLHAVRYQGVWAKTFRAAMASPLIGPPAESVFIDLGCGKGKAVMIAATYPFRRVIGVELSPALARAAERNIARFRRRNAGLAPIEIVVQDAGAFEYPPLPIIVYLHNPFDGVILARVAQRLRASIADQPRDALLIYHAPVHREVLDSAPDFEQRGLLPGGIVYGVKGSRD